MMTPRLGPLEMNQGTRKRTMPQNVLIMMRGMVRLVYAMLLWEVQTSAQPPCYVVILACIFFFCVESFSGFGVRVIVAS